MTTLGSIQIVTLIILVWLVVAGVLDLQTGRVSNWLTIPGVIAGAVATVMRGDDRLILFVTFTLALMAAYYFRAMGGADLKVLVALCGLRPDLLVASLIALSLWGTGRRLFGSAGKFRALPVVAVSSCLMVLIRLLPLIRAAVVQ